MLSFTRTFTRDNSLIIQEVWDAGYGKDYSDNQNPHQPTQVNYITDGVVEIWDNSEAIRWFEDQLYNKHMEDPSFFASEMKTYLPIAEEVKAHSGKDRFDSLDELASFVGRLEQGTHGFLIFYHSAKDSRTPTEIKEEAVKIREVDAFYDDADRLIKSTLKHFHPHTAGLSISITSSEIHMPPTKEVLLERFNHCIMLPGGTPEIKEFTAFQKEHPDYHFDIPEEVGS